MKNSEGVFSSLSARARNILSRAGICTLEQLADRTVFDLHRYRGCGLVVVGELRALLRANGLALKDERPTVPAPETPVVSDSSVVELRNKILAALRRQSPTWNVSEIDFIIAEFTDGLIDRERDIWQKARRPILDASALIQEIPPRNGPGELHVGANDKGEVVINLPTNMTGHICFTPHQARHLAVVLLRQAAAAAGEPLP